jgi:hypothetical protein
MGASNVAKPRLVLLTLIALTTTPLYAHDIYSGLITKRGASCCDDHDCRRIIE